LSCSERQRKKCPICEFITELRNDEEGNEALITALKTSRRMMMNIIDMSEEKSERKVRVWEVSHHYFGKAMDEALTSAYEDDEDNMDGFCDPEDGHYLKMVVENGWEGKGYQVERVDFKSRKEDLDDEILDQAVCLDEILVINSYGDLKELLLQDDDEDDKPKPKKRKKKDDDEDEDFDDEDEDFDDEDEDFDDEDDEDDDEDDEDDDDEDDDDEHVRPKRKKKKTTKKKATKKKATKKKTTKKKATKKKKAKGRGKRK